MSIAVIELKVNVEVELPNNIISDEDRKKVIDAIIITLPNIKDVYNIYSEDNIGSVKVSFDNWKDFSILDVV